MSDCPSIVIIGAGNVATHLCPALDSVGNVLQVWSRNIDNAKTLTASTHRAQPISELAELVVDADFYIISVPDNAIKDVAAALTHVSGIVAHTSGSVDINALSAIARRGVFYPLQTFSRNKSVDFADIPFFIEGSDDSVTVALENLASHLSQKVLRADSNSRAALHIAAVFACNFANHLWSISADILEKSGYSFDILRPLLLETLNKSAQMGPAAAQTGPARRNDTNVINAHLSKLDGDRHKLYELITKMIIAQNNE